MQDLSTIILSLISVVLSGICSYLFYKTKQNSNLKYTQNDIQDILKQQEVTYNDKLETELQQKLQQKINNHKADLDEKNQIILEKLKLQNQQELYEQEKKIRAYEIEIQDKINKKEEQLSGRQNLLEEEKISITAQKLELEKTKQELKNIRELLISKQKKIDADIVSKLEVVASFTKDQAKQYILTKSKDEIGQQLITLQHKMLGDAEDTANQKSREIVSLAIQRCSSEVTNEMTVTAVKLNGDEDKGKLIGKGGRNIQWLEKTLGVELIIDDTPEIVTISGFSGIRRHIAKKTVEKLVTDGRIHPSSIEEMYEKAKSEIATDIQNAGEEVVNELGIYDFPPKLVRIIGRLKFRTSYGQNMLKHSLEMAKLAGLLVDELSAAFPSSFEIDKMACVKGALLHDIGKAVDEEQIPKGNHIELGEKICDMFELDWKIKKCISSHHTTGGDYQSYDDKENGFCIEACIVDACDNISGSRPGARKETAEAYFQRMDALEKIANSVTGVKKSYIMRGSRELWVFFDPDTTNLASVHTATTQIVNKINSSIKSPFKIQVNCFLENRIVEFAG